MKGKMLSKTIFRNISVHLLQNVYRLPETGVRPGSVDASFRAILSTMSIEVVYTCVRHNEGIVHCLNIELITMAGSLLRIIFELYNLKRDGFGVGGLALYAVRRC